MHPSTKGIYVCNIITDLHQRDEGTAGQLLHNVGKLLAEARDAAMPNKSTGRRGSLVLLVERQSSVVESELLKGHVKSAAIEGKNELYRAIDRVQCSKDYAIRSNKKEVSIVYPRKQISINGKQHIKSS